MSAVLVPGSCRELLTGRALAHPWFTSRALIEELEAGLRGKLNLEPERTPLYLVYRRRVEVVTPAPLAAPVCRDRDDDEVLATALSAGADVIITGDKDLLVLGKHKGIRIRSPRQFLEDSDA